MRTSILMLFTMSSAMRADDINVFLAEYAPHAQRVKDSFSNVNYRYHLIAYTNEQQPFQWITSDILSRHGMLRIKAVEERVRRPDGKIVNIALTGFLRNHRYSASLELGKHGYAASDCTPSIQVKSNYISHACAYANRMTQDVTYYDFLKNKALECVSCSENEWRGQHVKRVVVDYGFKNERNNKLQRGRYCFYFRTDYEWVCAGMSIYELEHAADNPTYEEAYSFERQSDGMIILTGIDSYRWLHKENRLLKYSGGKVTAFQRHSQPIPEAEFTLSAFGLPEPAVEYAVDQRFCVGLPADAILPPPPLRSGWFPWWGWLVGVLFLLLGYLIHLKVKRVTA